MKTKKLIALVVVAVLMLTSTTLTFAEAKYHSTVTFSSTECVRNYFTHDWISKSSGETWNKLRCYVIIDSFSSNPNNIHHVGAQAFSAKTSGVALSEYRTINSGIFYKSMDLKGNNTPNTMYMKITNIYSTSGYNGSSNTINMQSHGKFKCQW